MNAVHASTANVLASANQHAALYDSHVKKVADADAQLRDALRNFSEAEIVMTVANMMNCGGPEGVRRAVKFLDELNQRLKASGRDPLLFHREGWYINIMMEE